MKMKQRLTNFFNKAISAMDQPSPTQYAMAGMMLAYEIQNGRNSSRFGKLMRQLSCAAAMSLIR